MAKTLPISDVKMRFPQIIRGVEKREDEIVVTRKGYPAAVILSYSELSRLRETVEVLSDPHLMAQIRKSREFFKKRKKGLKFEDVFGEPLHPKPFR